MIVTPTMAENDILQNLERVYITSDDDGHNYVIPFELKNRFHEDLSKLIDTDYREGLEEFEEKYDKYMTEGDINLIPLYTIR